MKIGHSQVSYSTGDETGLDLEGQKEKGKSIHSLPASLAGVACGLSAGVCWNWGLG